MKNFLAIAALLFSAATFASNGNPAERDSLKLTLTEEAFGDQVCCKKKVTVGIWHEEQYYSADAEITACVDPGKTFDETYALACTEAHDTALAVATSLARQMVADAG